MLILKQRAHFIVFYRQLSFSRLRPSTTISSTPSTDIIASKESQTSFLNQFIIQQLSWKLSHQPHPSNMRKTHSSTSQVEKNTEDSSKMNNWDLWFTERNSSNTVPSVLHNQSLSSERFSTSNSTPTVPNKKRQWSSTNDLLDVSRKRNREETRFEGQRNLSKRLWSTTEYQERLDRSHYEHFAFRIVSYNILAQKLIEDNRNLYWRCAPYDLEWSQRKHRLFDEIIYQNADIICLQEMQDVHYYSDFRPRMSEYGYESIYLKRSGDKTDGCALFYRKNRLNLIRSRKVPFYQRNIEVLDRENCGLIALFQPKTSKATSNDLFCVANTHLLFSPKRGDIKLAQTQYFLAEIDRLSSKDDLGNNYYPIIFCGDFNAEPKSPLSRFLIDGYIKYDDYRRIEISGQIPSSLVNDRFSLQLPSEYLLPPTFVTPNCRFPDTTAMFDSDQTIFDTDGGIKSSTTLTHNKRFRSVYDMNDASKVTTRINDDTGFVDYIFYTRANGDRNRLNLLSRYELYDQTVAPCVNLPNHQFPSDHFLLAAQFALKLHKRRR